MSDFAGISPEQAVGVSDQAAVSKQRRAARRFPLAGAYGALLIFVLIYFARPEDWIPGLSTAPLAKIAGIVSIFALLASIRQIRNRIPREISFLFFLVVQMFLASLVSPVWRGGALDQTLDFAKVLIVVLLIATSVSTLKRLRYLMFTQALSVAAISAVAVWKGHLILGRLEGVLSGIYADPNDMALGIIISIPLCMALLFTTKNWIAKAFWSVSILIMLYAVFLTGSRGGFLAFLVMSMICLWQFAIRGRRRYLLLVVPIAGLVLWQVSGGMLVGRLVGTFDENNDKAAAYASGQARQQLFFRSIEVTEEHPLFGVGPGNFGQVSGQWHTTHNSFTLMSSEAGIPALILYSLILWCGFQNLRAARRLLQKKPESLILGGALFASLAAYLVGSSFLSLSYQFFPYILVGYTTALLSVARSATPQTRKRRSAYERADDQNFLFDCAEPEISLN